MFHLYTQHCKLKLVEKSSFSVLNTVILTSFSDNTLSPQHRMYAHFPAHDLLQSPDEAKWKWVQRSYDRGRRKHRTTLNYNHSFVLMLVGRVHFFLVGVKKEPGLCFNSRYNFLLRKQPCQVGLKSCLTICVVFWTDTVFLRLNKADKLYTGGFSRENNCSNSWWAGYIKMLQFKHQCTVQLKLNYNSKFMKCLSRDQWVLYRKRMTQRNKSNHSTEMKDYSMN